MLHAKRRLINYQMQYNDTTMYNVSQFFVLHCTWIYATETDEIVANIVSTSLIFMAGDYEHLVRHTVTQILIFLIGEICFQ